MTDEPEKTTFGGRLRRYFFTGIIVTAPIVLTFSGAWWFIKLVDKGVAKILPPMLNPNLHLPFDIPGTGLLIAVVFFILIGWFARNFLGRIIIKWSEYVVSRMPVLNTVYQALKQMFEMTMGAQSKAFREVVMFEFPRVGSWTIGFVTGKVEHMQKESGVDDLVNVFLPTTPTTAGFLLFMPRKDLIPLKMTPEEAVKLIVSGGIITPPEKG